jgi:hypothetical protein
MRERRRDDARDILLDDPGLPRPGAKHVAFGVGEHVLDSAPVAVVDDGLGRLVGERPGDTHTLGWGKGQVEAGYRDGSTGGRLRGASDWLAAHRVGELDQHLV